MILFIHKQTFVFIIFVCATTYAADRLTTYVADPLLSSSMLSSCSESSSVPSSLSSQSSSCSCSTSSDDDSFQESDTDSDEAPLCKYVRTQLSELPTDIMPYQQTMYALQTAIQELPHVSLSKEELCQKIQMLQMHIITLTQAVTTLKQRQEHIFTCNQTSRLSLDELIQSWQITVPQFMRTSPEHALVVADSYLNALPVAMRTNDHFFVQHIFLSKANLYHRWSVQWKQSGYQSMPGHINLQAHVYLKQARHFLNFVNPKLLSAAMMDSDICISARQTYNALKQQLAQDELLMSQQLRRPSKEGTFISMVPTE